MSEGMTVPTCCLSCRWWKCLSATSTHTTKACHLFLQTGVRNGRKGDVCATWEPRGDTKG